MQVDQATYPATAEKQGGQAIIAVVRALAKQNNPDEILRLAQEQVAKKTKLADWMLRVATEELPDNLVLAVHYCALAESRGEQDVADRRWSALRRRSLRDVHTHVAFIEYLLRQHRFGDAETACLSASTLLKQPRILMGAHAQIAEERGDWAEAARRWQAAMARYPDDVDAAARQRAASERALHTPFCLVEDSGAGVAIPAVGPEEASTVRTLLMEFESMGANCEFGLLQRKFGASPLGLLRFSSTSPDTLMTLLQTRFAGIGDADTMTLVKGREDYQIGHLLTRWTMHTLIKPGPTVDEAKLLDDQVKRAKYLSRKLEEDLEDNSKIFVYQKGRLKDNEIDAIFVQMQSYGPTNLMCVRLHDAKHPAGTVEWRNDRLMICAIDRRGKEFAGSGWNISIDYWVYFCRMALSRWGAPSVTHRGAAQAA